MSDLITMLSAASGAAGGEDIDPNFNQTVLLLHGDGTSGAQNNTFLDSSTNNFTITRNGNTTQGTFSPFSLPDGRWSNYFDGTGDYLNLGGQSALAFGTGDWTIEFWIYATSSGGTLFDTRPSGTVSTNGYGVIFLSSGTVRYDTAAAVRITGSISILNTWTHVAVCKASGTTRLFINGVQDGSSYSDSTNYLVGANRPIIGADGNNPAAVLVTGYFSNYRILKGTGLYTSNFTPPTSPLTAITNTSLLTCQSNRFVDNSTNNFAITRNGDVKVTPFSPFAPTAAYDASVNGGSGYFDGTGDSLTRAFISTTDGMYLQGSTYTIEAWVYPNALSGTQYIYICNASNVFQYGYNTLYLSGTSVAFATRVSTGGTEYARSGGTLTVGQWAHIAVSVSSDVAKLFLNGVQIGADLTIAANTFTPTGAGIGLNQNGAAGGTAFNGYISNLRIVQGQSLTTGDFTPPTIPITTSAIGWTGANVAGSLTGTIGLLLNFTNAGIFDNTGKNNLETVGNAQIDTSVKKYGTGSMEFDGTGDSLFIPSNENFRLIGDFTIEMWFRADSLSSSGLLSNNRALFEVDAFAFILGHPSYVNKLSVWSRNISNSVPFLESGTLSTGVFYHLAVTRSGSNIYLFLDGVEVDTASSTVTFPLNTLGTNIGKYWGGDFDGYIDDLRITKGVARYTAAFTPPAKEFPNL